MDYAVLAFLAGQGPGYYEHQTTIADALDVSVDTIHDSLNRLRNRDPRNKKGRAGYGIALVHSERVKIGTWLPGASSRTRTKDNGYWLTFELLELLNREDARRAQVAAKKRQLHVVAQPEPPRPERQLETDLSWAEPEIQALAAAFDTLALPTSSGAPRRKCSTSELQALRNRFREGCSLEELRAAVGGASVTCWTRLNGGQGWAVDPSLWCSTVPARCASSPNGAAPRPPRRANSDRRRPPRRRRLPSHPPLPRFPSPAARLLLRLLLRYRNRSRPRYLLDLRDR